MRLERVRFRWYWGEKIILWNWEEEKRKGWVKMGFK